MGIISKIKSVFTKSSGTTTTSSGIKSFASDTSLQSTPFTPAPTQSTPSGPSAGSTGGTVRISGGGGGGGSRQTLDTGTPIGTSISGGTLVADTQSKGGVREVRQSIAPEKGTRPIGVRGSSAKENVLQMSLLDQRQSNTEKIYFENILAEQRKASSMTPEEQFGMIGKDPRFSGMSTPQGEFISFSPAGASIGFIDYKEQGIFGRGYEKFTKAVTFIDTFGGRYQPFKGDKVYAGTVPLAPSPAVAVKVLGTSRLFFTGVTQSGSGRKVLTDVGFLSKYEFFPIGTTQKGIATTETIFGQQTKGLFISRGTGQLFKRGVSFPTATEKIVTGQKFASASMGLAGTSKGKTLALSVGRTAPNIYKVGKTSPFADISIIKRGKTLTGLFGRTFVGTGDVISTKIKPIQTAGILKEVSSQPIFKLLPQGTRGQSALVPRLFGTSERALNIGFQREVGLSQTQSFIRAYSSTIQTPKIITGISQLTRLTPLTGFKFVSGLNIRGTITGQSISNNLITRTRQSPLTITKELTRQIGITGLVPRASQTLRTSSLLIPILTTRQIITNIPSFSTRTITRTTPTFPIPRTPLIPITPIFPFGLYGLESRRGRGSGLFGNFFSRYTPSLTSSTFRLFGKPSSKALKTGIVTPFERRYLLGRLRKVVKKRRTQPKAKRKRRFYSDLLKNTGVFN